MVSLESLYQRRKMMADDAVRLVSNGDTVIVPTGPGEPPRLLTALSEQRRDFRRAQAARGGGFPAVRSAGHPPQVRLPN